MTEVLHSLRSKIPFLMGFVVLLLSPIPASALSSTDNFNRANGTLGSNWTDFSEAGPLILSNQVIGTGASYSGATRTGESYTSNQFSEIEVGTVIGTQTVSATVRTQSGGQSLYAGVYAYQSGTPVLKIMKRVSGTYTQLGLDVSVSALSSGTKLRIMVVGTTIALLQDGVQKIAVYDNALSGGAPGFQTFGTPTLDNWSGGDQSFQFNYLSTDVNGVKSYDMISQYNGYGSHILRVLEPTAPTAGIPHSFLYELPVEPEGSYLFGNGMESLRAVNAHNQYNVTILSPSFEIYPWYVDSPLDLNHRHESFMTLELQPWAKANLATSGNEQHWLIGFSKSGIGGQDLILRNPTIFDLVASWDFPPDIPWSLCGTDDSQSCTTAYGTEANYNLYMLDADFLEAYKSPFLTHTRMWFSANECCYSNEVTAYTNLLTSKNIRYITSPITAQTGNLFQDHNWSAGWLPSALSALRQNSLPAISSFSIPGTSSSLTVNIDSFTATDSVSVTGYKITESSTAPSINDSGWSVSAPITYTFASAGSKTLFAWAKNLSGSVSLSQTASTTITLPPTGGSFVCTGCFTPPKPPQESYKLIINNGQTTTRERIVTLNLNAGPDIKKMAVSITGDFMDASQEDYQSTKQFDLCSKFANSIKDPICPDGKYTIYVKFYTAYGVTSDSSIASSSIILASNQNKTLAEPFTKYLRYGQIDFDVKRLQIFLNKDTDTRLADSGPGSSGKETNTFGPITKRAVIRFQEKYAKDILFPYGLSKGTGFVGSSTVSKINQILSGGF